jgi:hypothetical protein
MIAAEGLGLSPEIHYAALAVLAIAKGGAFDVCPEVEAEVPAAPAATND